MIGSILINVVFFMKLKKNNELNNIINHYKIIHFYI